MSSHTSFLIELFRLNSHSKFQFMPLKPHVKIVKPKSILATDFILVNTSGINKQSNHKSGINKQSNHKLEVKFPLPY